MTRSQRQRKSDLSITDGGAAGMGSRIRQLRGTASQREFAERLGISREQLSRIESGAQVPGTETLRRLAQATRASLDFVVLGGAATEPRAASVKRGGWVSALQPLLDATTVRLPPGAGRRADRAWGELSETRKEEVRAFVRRVAVAAVALEALLPSPAARAVGQDLGAVLASLLPGRIAAAGRRARG